VFSFDTLERPRPTGPGTSPGRPGAARLEPVWHRYGLGLLSALATAVLMGWGLGRIAFWLDEGASVVATQRTWPNLWVLIGSPEAPLMPYYALLKTFVRVGRVVPGLGEHPEILFRLPSVIATVLATGILVSWLQRAHSSALAAASATVLLLIGGFSRYGQEARPYAAVLLVAVVATVIWTRLIDDPRRRWAVAYAGSLALMIALNSLSALLVPAHLAAAVVATEPGQRRRALLRTVVAAVPGLLLVSPLALAASRNGTGPLYVFPTLTFDHALAVFVRLFSFGRHPLLGVGPVILLAGLGLTRLNSERYRFVARLAACWAIVPPAALVLVVLVQPNLLFGRYILFVLPAWAILAGLGLITAAELSTAAAGRLLASVPRIGPPGRARVSLGSAAAVTAVLIAGTAAQSAWTLSIIRTPGGHGDDIRPALAAADRPENLGLPIVVSSRYSAGLVGAYRRADEKRLATVKFQRDQAQIWPAPKSAARQTRFLSRHPRLILLQRAGSVPGCAEPDLTAALDGDPNAGTGGPLVTLIERCMPDQLRRSGYRVTEAEPAGRNWVFTIVQRIASPS
jgi:hypothetical protein